MLLVWCGGACLCFQTCKNEVGTTGVLGQPRLQDPCLKNKTTTKKTEYNLHPKICNVKMKSNEIFAVLLSSADPALSQEIHHATFPFSLCLSPAWSESVFIGVDIVWHFCFPCYNFKKCYLNIGQFINYLTKNPLEGRIGLAGTQTCLSEISYLP